MKLEVGRALEARRLVVKPQMKTRLSLLEVQQARRLAGTIRRPGNPWPMTGPRKKGARPLEVSDLRQVRGLPQKSDNPTYATFSPIATLGVAQLVG